MNQRCGSGPGQGLERWFEPVGSARSCYRHVPKYSFGVAECLFVDLNVAQHLGALPGAARPQVAAGAEDQYCKWS